MHKQNFAFFNENRKRNGNYLKWNYVCTVVLFLSI